MLLPTNSNPRKQLQQNPQNYKLHYSKGPMWKYYGPERDHKQSISDATTHPKKMLYPSIYTKLTGNSLKNYQWQCRLVFQLQWDLIVVTFVKLSRLVSDKILFRCWNKQKYWGRRSEAQDNSCLYL